MSHFSDRILSLGFILLVISVVSCKQTNKEKTFKETSFPKAFVTLDQIDSVFNYHVEKNDIPGGVVQIIKEGQIIYWKPFGFMDIEEEKPMTQNAIFRITFMTAPITNTALLILYDEGRFSLDDPVSKYIPEFANPRILSMSQEVDEYGQPAGYTVEPAQTEITIRHLLNQTSGLTYSFYNHPFIADIYRERGISNGLVQTEGRVGEMVNKLATVPLLFNPGESWHYGMNADVVGYLVEVLSGQPLDAFISEHICQPLGMEDTYFYVPEQELDRVVSLYQPQVQEGKLMKYPPGIQDIQGMAFSPVYDELHPKTYFSGGAGLFSTVYDYNRFLQMMLNLGELDGTRILKTETARMMISDQLGGLEFFAPTLSFGFGFYVQISPFEGIEASSVGSFSWGGLFNTSFLVDPALKMSFVVMSQMLPPGNFEVREKLDPIIFGSLVP